MAYPNKFNLKASFLLTKEEMTTKQITPEGFREYVTRICAIQIAEQIINMVPVDVNDRPNNDGIEYSFDLLVLSKKDFARLLIDHEIEVLKDAELLCGKLGRYGQS